MLRAKRLLLLALSTLYAATTWANDATECERHTKPENYAAAYESCKSAAADGNTKAKVALAEMYAAGNYVQQNSQRAFELYKDAAEQENAKAQLALGNLYYYAFGLVIQDYEEALRYYELAAHNGNAQAQYMLGSMYSAAQGVTEDDVKAHMWLNIASANGYSGASRLRELVSVNMTQEEISKAQKKANECLNTSYQNCD